MPLNKNALKSDIKKILKDLASRTENQEKAIDDYKPVAFGIYCRMQ